MTRQKVIGRNVPKLRFPEFWEALDYPLPASPLSGGGAWLFLSLVLPGIKASPQSPPLIRGGLGWGYQNAGDQS